MAESITNVLGIVSIKNRGEYNSETSYEKLNVVTYQGSSYCAKGPTQGNLPTNTDYWQLYAEKGATGPQGPQGPQGATGNPGASPLVASSTAGMTDTTRIYVNTTDGHWYSYNGKSWEDGGVYQATQIADNSVTNNMLQPIELLKIINTSSKNYENLFDKDTCVLGYFQNHGNTFISGPSSYKGNTSYVYTSDYIPCSANEHFIKNWYGVSRELTFYDEDKEYVSGMEAYSNKFTIPDDVTIKYFRISIMAYTTDLTISFYITPLEKAMVLKGDTLPDYYIPFKRNFINDLTSISNMPNPVIFDTDWRHDVDDAVALGVLLECEKSNLVDIVCAGISVNSPKSVGSMDAFFTYCGRPNIAIGCDKTKVRTYDSEWVEDLNDNFPHTLTTATCEDVVRTYRRALANTQKPINFIITGSLRNLYNLLLSSADDISTMNGYELLYKNTNNIYVMGGRYPSGNEANFVEDKVAAKYVCDHCPVNIVFCGWEVGNTVITGGNILTEYEYNIIARALHTYIESHPDYQIQGRYSWDPLTVMLGCLDNATKAGYNLVYGKNSVNEETGDNTFTVQTLNRFKHSYVVKNHPDDWYVHQINSIIVQNTLPTRINLGQQGIKRITI